MAEVKHCSLPELEAGLEEIRRSPGQEGRLVLIVRRPAVDGREVLEAGQLNEAEGLAGDRWARRSPKPDAQLTLMNARVIALLAQAPERWPLAGDQLFVDLDLSVENLPPGTRLAVGGAVIEITPLPHTGCSKFSARFGAEAFKFVNSPAGKQLRLRGVYARVVQPGPVRAGDRIKKLT